MFSRKDKVPSTPRDTTDDADGDFFGEFQKRVASKRDDQRTLNLSRLNTASHLSTSTVLGHLFVFYCSKFAHTFLAEDSAYNFIPQEAAVEVLVSSELEQHELEFIWNEAKADSVPTTTQEEDEEQHSGLNRREFVSALQLVALAQASFPCTLQHLHSHGDTVPLPAVWVDIAFTRYLEVQRVGDGVDDGAPTVPIHDGHQTGGPLGSDHLNGTQRINNCKEFKVAMPSMLVIPKRSPPTWSG